MNIKKRTFEDLMDLNTEGLVLLGCGGDLNEWINGVTEILVEEKIIKSTNPLDTFDKPFYVRTTGGRTDLVLPFKKRAKINISKLAMWRLRFGDASWISDYKHNYAAQHGVELDDEH